MKYTGSLSKKEREKIFELFLNKEKLKFSDIEKALNIRSNMVSYHITQMQKEGLLEKKGDYYHITKHSEKYIPIFSNITGEELSPLPVILVAIVHKKEILLIKRNKRPYKDYWSMIGGKMHHDESFVDASLRIVKQKTGLAAKFLSINALMHERVHDDGLIKHSFILFFTKVFVDDQKFRESNHGALKWIALKNIEKNDIIHSDMWLIKNKIDARIDAKSVYMKEENGKLIDFQMID
jgi:ADP-ribose pyrophosphatase YjhB (NUDIX family)